MCGIVGYVGFRNASEFLIQGLRRLEYRGYDSSGIVTITPSGQFALAKAAGRLDRLVTLLADEPADGHLGIGHTRWATHGAHRRERSPALRRPAPRAGDRTQWGDREFTALKEYLLGRLRIRIGHGHRSCRAPRGRLPGQGVGDAGPQGQPTAANGYQPLVAAVAGALAKLQGTYGLAIVFRKYPGVIHRRPPTAVRS